MHFIRKCFTSWSIFGIMPGANMDTEKEMHGISVHLFIIISNILNSELDDALANHCISNLHKACNVCTTYVVDIAISLLTIS